MKAATRLLLRRTARAREAEDLKKLRHVPGPLPPAGYPGPQLPLSLAPYRLQAADRWWHETRSASPDNPRKRS